MIRSSIESWKTAFIWNINFLYFSSGIFKNLLASLAPRVFIWVNGRYWKEWDGTGGVSKWMRGSLRWHCVENPIFICFGSWPFRAKGQNLISCPLSFSLSHTHRYTDASFTSWHPGSDRPRGGSVLWAQRLRLEAGKVSEPLVSRTKVGGEKQNNTPQPAPLPAWRTDTSTVKRYIQRLTRQT